MGQENREAKESGRTVGVFATDSSALASECGVRGIQVIDMSYIARVPADVAAIALERGYLRSNPETLASGVCGRAAVLIYSGDEEAFVAAALDGLLSSQPAGWSGNVFVLGPLRVAVEGGIVEVAGRRIDLTPILFPALVELCRAWPDGQAVRLDYDDVRRLRGALGSASWLIRTVHRRGYRLALEPPACV